MDCREGCGLPGLFIDVFNDFDLSTAAFTNHHDFSLLHYLDDLLHYFSPPFGPSWDGILLLRGATCPQTGCSGLAPARELRPCGTRAAATSSCRRFMDKSSLWVWTIAMTAERIALGSVSHATMTLHKSKPSRKLVELMADLSDLVRWLDLEGGRVFGEKPLNFSQRIDWSTGSPARTEQPTLGQSINGRGTESEELGGFDASERQPCGLILCCHAGNFTARTLKKLGHDL